MIRFHFILTFLLISISSFSQNNKIDSTSNVDQSIFFDEFIDNRNEWSLEVCLEDSTISKIENGKFYFENNSLNSIGVSLDSGFDQNRNFEIETSYMFIKKSKKSGGLLFWGRDSNDRSFYFNFCINGVSYFGNFQSIADGKWYYGKKASIKKRAFNKVVVRKTDQEYFFYINDKLVYTHPFVKFYGNLIGFGAFRQSIVLVDYIRISYIKKQ